MITPVLGQGGAAHRRLLRLSSKASGGRRAAARGDRRSIRELPSLSQAGTGSRTMAPRGWRQRRKALWSGEAIVTNFEARKNPIAWKNQVFMRAFMLTLVGGLSKIRQPRTPSARSDTRPPPPSLILTGESTFWPANVREGRPKNADFCPPTRVNQLDRILPSRTPLDVSSVHCLRVATGAAR